MICNFKNCLLSIKFSADICIINFLGQRSFAVIEDSDEDIENNASDRNNDNDEDDDDDEEDDSDDNAANEEDVNDSSSGNDDTEEIRLKEENEQAEEEDNSVKITEELESNKVNIQFHKFTVTSLMFWVCLFHR